MSGQFGPKHIAEFLKVVFGLVVALGLAWIFFVLVGLFFGSIGWALEKIFT
jgi:hypothetical protein